MTATENSYRIDNVVERNKRILVYVSYLQDVPGRAVRTTADGLYEIPLAGERLWDVTVYLREHWDTYINHLNTALRYNRFDEHCPYWVWSAGEDLLHRLDEIRPPAECAGTVYVPNPGECGDEWNK